MWGENLFGKCWYEGQYPLCLRCDLSKGPSVIKDCSIGTISLGIAADMRHLYQIPQKGWLKMHCFSLRFSYGNPTFSRGGQRVAGYPL